MSGRSFDTPPDGPLLSAAVGDVLAARRAARGLLAGAPADAADGSLATLFLTATLVHCAVLGGGEARRREVADYLQGVLDAGTPEPGMLRSPMQFLRYAGAELAALLPQPQCRLVAHLLSLVSHDGYVEDCGPEDVTETAHREP